MKLSEDENIQKYAKSYRNTLLPYEYEFTCITCGFNVTKTRTL